MIPRELACGGHRPDAITTFRCRVIRRVGLGHGGATRGGYGRFAGPGIARGGGVILMPDQPRIHRPSEFGVDIGPDLRGGRGRCDRQHNAMQKELPWPASSSSSFVSETGSRNCQLRHHLRVELRRFTRNARPALDAKGQPVSLSCLATVWPIPISEGPPGRKRCPAQTQWAKPPPDRPLPHRYRPESRRRPGQVVATHPITPDLDGRAAGDLGSVLRKVELRECGQGRGASAD